MRSVTVRGLTGHDGLFRIFLYLCWAVHKELAYMTYMIFTPGLKPAAVQNYAFKENWKSTQ